MKPLHQFIERGKLCFFLLVMSTLLVPSNVMGQTELAAYDGKATNDAVSFDGFKDTRWQETEHINPAPNFTEMNGKSVFDTPACDPENQCEITYKLFDRYDDGWDGNAQILVLNSNVEIAWLRIENGESGQLRSLSLCDGETYSFVWVCGSCDDECSFEFYGPDGNLIQGMNYSEGEVPSGDYGEQLSLVSDYEIQCPSCKKPRDLSFVATSNSASFTWTADAGYTTWELQYSTDETNWSTVQTVTGLPSCSIENLQPATMYFARVRANCGDGNYSPWTAASFFTDCATLVIDATHPYAESFDSYDPYDPYGGGEWKGLRMGTSEMLPVCWNSLNMAEDYEQSMYPYIFNDYWEMESNGLKFYVYNNEGEGAMMNQYAILPSIQDINGLQMTLKAMAGESSGWAPFSIGVMSDLNDEGSFIEIQSFEASDDWDNYIVYFNNYSGQGDNIAIKIGTPDEWNSYILYVDDIEVSVLPTCFVPSDLSVDNIGETTADLTLVPYGQETAWQVRYSTNQNRWTTVDFSEQNPDEAVTVHLTGLNANTLYYVQVRANCGDGDYSVWSSMKSFRTVCGEYQPLPYYEDFESFDLNTWPYEYRIPPCWTYINSSNGQYTNNQSYPSMGNDAGSSITKYLYFLIIDYDYLNHHYGYDPQPEYAIMPEMESLDNVVLRFSGKGEENNYWLDYYHTIVVGYVDDNDDFHPVQTIELDENHFTEYTVNFDYPGSGRIYFMLDAPGTHGSRMYHSIAFIDNIVVETAGSGDLVPITAYSNENPGWNFIASPITGTLSPEMVDQMTNESFDLFAFDQNADGTEWQNYKVQGFELENGFGYLYANSNDVALRFVGDMQSASQIEVPLVYSEGKTYAGWNLVGNPFNCPAYINRDYYIMKEDGTGVNPVAVSPSTPIPPYTGIFVKAETEGETVVFTRAAQ